MPTLKRLYFILKAQKPIWKYVANARAHFLHRAHQPRLSKLGARIVSELEREGIAVTTLHELFPDGPSIESLHDYAASLEHDSQNQSRKAFLRTYWSNKVQLDARNPFLGISLSSQLIDVACTYLDMWPRLKHYTLNRTEIVPSGAAAQFSQRWHRDPQEKRMLKVFIYLSEVDAGAGPFTYVRGSTSGNRYGSLFPQHFPGGSYPEEGCVEAAVASQDIVPMTGSAGTVIFCDTTGLHRGGYATERERLMFTAFYCAPSYKDQRWYVNDGSFKASTLPLVAQFALHEA